MTLSLPHHFHASLLAAGRSAAYARKMLRVIERFQDSPALRLTEAARGMSPATLEDVRKRLGIYAGWLEREGHGEEARRFRCLPSVRAGKASRSKAAWTAEEVRRLLGCPRIPSRRRVAYRVMATLGLRPVEVCRLRAEHFVQHGAEWRLVLPAADQKSRREDALVVSRQEAARILEALPLLEERELAHFERTFQRDLVWAGINPRQGQAVRRLYDLRSFLGSELLRQGVDLETVRQLMRHARITTTLQHYIRHQEGRAGAVRAAALRGVV